MALSEIGIVPSDGSVTFSDGAALSFVAPYEDGNLSFGGVRYQMREVEDYWARDNYIGSRLRRNLPLEFQFDAMFVGWTDAAAATLHNIVYRSGLWVAAASTLPAVAGGGPASVVNSVWACQLVFAAERTNFGGTGDASVTMKYCVLEEAFAEGGPAKLSIKGSLKPYSNDYLVFA